MELIAVLIQKTKVESGTNTDGKEWQRCTAVFQTIEQYPKKVAIIFLNNMVPMICTKKVGTLYKVKLDAESRFFEGRWYTDLRAWKIEPAYNIESMPETSNEKQDQDPTNEASSNFDTDIDPL